MVPDGLSANLTGSNLITNGTFASNINSWTDNSGSGSSISHSSDASGQLKFTGSAAYALATQGVTVVNGGLYAVTYRVVTAGHGSNQGDFNVGTSSNSGNVFQATGSSDTVTGWHTKNFIAQGTTNYITFKTCR